MNKTIVASGKTWRAGSTVNGLIELSDRDGNRMYVYERDLKASPQNPGLYVAIRAFNTIADAKSEK